MSSTVESKTSAALALDQWTRAYRSMVRIRIFEEHVNDLYTRALMPGLAEAHNDLGSARKYLREFGIVLPARTTNSEEPLLVDD